MSEENKLSSAGRLAVMIVGVLVLGTVVSLAILRDRIVNQQWRTVTVTGQGRVAFNPDLAIVTLGVQIDKVAKPEDALNQLNSKVAGIIAALNTAGVPTEAIQTQNYSLYPQYDYKDNVSEVSGYNANQQLVVKINGYDEDQAKLSRVIAAASKSGANQVNSLTFDSSQMNDLKQQARLAAISDARDKSTALAETAGVELKNITSWYENYINPVPVYSTSNEMGMGMGGGGGAPVTPAGEREVVIEIGVTYNLK